MTIKINKSTPAQQNANAELLDAVRGLYAAIEQFDMSVATELGVDRTSLRAINAMELGPTSPGALGEALGLSSGSVTALLDRLERGAHVERLAVDGDGRRRDINLKEPTRAKANSHYARLGNQINDTFEALEIADLLKAILTLRDLATCFNHARGM